MELRRSLDGKWEFQIDPLGTRNAAHLNLDREIIVPLPWQAALPELIQYSGYGWYRRTIELDTSWLRGELLLRFGAVDYWCEVFVNGHRVGEHEGGYTPFAFPIRAYARSGQNEIVVRVYDSVQDGITIPRWPDYTNKDDAKRPPFDAQNVPHGKQEWYINVGGIWQGVTLSAVPETYIDNVRIIPNIHTGQVEVIVRVAHPGTLGEGTLRVAIDTVAEMSTSLISGQTVYTQTLAVPDPQHWTPDTPNLYTASITLQKAEIEDNQRIRFGFREIAARDGQLWLNGEPLYLLAALDQDFYADTIYTVPSENYLRDEFRKAKELGLNCLRCHIKAPDPLYLDLADEIGVLIWAEIPSWRTFYVKAPVHPGQLDLNDSIRNRVNSTLQAMIERDFNHPSLIIWSIVNEDWGTALPLSAADRAWVSTMYDTCKRLDSTRLVVDNSACPGAWGPNIHVKSDLDDFHTYVNIPDQAKGFVQTIEQFSLRPLWTYSSNGDAQRTGKEPLVLSEFGNWGLPTLRQVRQGQEDDPSWFGVGSWWSPWEGAPGWPRHADIRFEQLGLSAIWPDFDTFATMTQWHQFYALKFEIETMRRQSAISGYVITELADIYWESNGLLDFYRQPKAYHDRFATINALDVIVPQPDRYACWDDQPLRVTLCGSHYSKKDWASARLRWWLDQNSPQGERKITDVTPGTVKEFGATHVALPKTEQINAIHVQFTLTDVDEMELARNTLDLLVLPANVRQAIYQGPIAALMRHKAGEVIEVDVPKESPEATEVSASSVGVSNEMTPEISGVNPAPVRHMEPTAFSETLQRLGYQVGERIASETKVIVTDYPDATMLQWVRDGGDMLYLSVGPGPFFWRQGRSGPYGGSWITSFSWLRPGIYRRLAVANPLTLPFMHAMPTGAIVGLPLEDKAVQTDFLAGQVSGWVHHPAVHTVQFRYGKGRVIMTTFALQDAMLSDPNDPIPVAMFHDLIDHLCSDRCQPSLRANY